MRNLGTMKADLNDLNAFVAVARAGGFREAAREGNVSASRLSDAVRRLETQLGVRLFHRSTCSVVPTEAGSVLLDRLGRPKHPRDLLKYPCLMGRYRTGVVNSWEFEKGGQVIEIRPSGPLTTGVGSTVDLAVQAAIAGTGVINLFEEWLQPYLDDGRLEPVLKPWWQSFSGPYRYYSGRRLVPAPLWAFIDFVKNMESKPSA